jgi:N-acetylmuramoyl-L-alanine amidase
MTKPFRLTNHRIEGVPFLPARLTGAAIRPSVVVLHDTAGRLDKGNSARYLAETPKASVHFVVERDGSITQLVETNRLAGHAGQSTYQGRADVNGFSVGIEIVNPGKMTRLSGGSAITWYGQEFGYGAHKLAEITTPEHGAGVWMPYTEDQIAAVYDLLMALFDGIDTLRDITTHWYISPGRKIDTNPLFPLESLRARVLGRDDPADQVAEAMSDGHREGTYLRVNAPSSGLNIRRWPSFNPNVIATAPHGAELPVLRTGIFGGMAWHLVRFDGREGWIVDRYTQTVTV